ncbi:MAG TPA: MmcQ/YjbR family DNA-binding protein [Saprospiraceae bacterium]|nr:MmcQ/YjbR family DNA-binding protein [Saprospiraceae bacterium]
MDIEEFRSYCLSKPGVTEEFPFGPETLVFKLKGKIFAIAPLDADRFRVNLKCDPDTALTLREQYEEVQPGYHMNKRHWNTVDFQSRLSDRFLKAQIDRSYDLVKSTLPIKDRF